MRWPPAWPAPCPPSDGPTMSDTPRTAAEPLPAEPALGVAGRLARSFQSNALTPLLALVALLLGLFAVLVTPREEEPQINVTMANVLIPFPGASSADVQAMVARPAEAALGTLPPIVRPKGIDDVPVLGITLWADDQRSALDLERVAHTLEAELKRVSGTREVVTIGGPGQVVQVTLNPARLRERGVDVLRLKNTLAAANLGMPAGAVLDTQPGATGAPQKIGR